MNFVAAAVAYWAMSLSVCLSRCVFMRLLLLLLLSVNAHNAQAFTHSASKILYLSLNTYVLRIQFFIVEISEYRVDVCNIFSARWREKECRFIKYSIIVNLRMSGQISSPLPGSVVIVGSNFVCFFFVWVWVSLR